MKLINMMLRIQKRERLSHIKMAEKLGISRQQWWRIRTGNEPMSPAIRERALGNWQEELLPIFLSENVTNSNKSKKES